MVALKNIIVIFLNIIAILLMLAGCSKDNNLPFTTIGKGFNLSGVDREKEKKIISQQEEWDDFFMNWPRWEIDQFNEIVIDYDKYQIIAVIDETRPDTGWSINITQMTEHSDKIILTVQVKKSDGRAFFLEIQPYHIVKIPKTTKSIEFKLIY